MHSTDKHVSNLSSGFPIGTEYWRPPMPPESVWEQDFERIRQAGMTIVRFFPVWPWLEPEPDRFRFEPIERFFDLAAQFDLNVLFSFSTGFDAPAWLYKQYPDLRPVLNHGEFIEPHARAAFPLGGCFPCTDHPAWRERHEHLVRATVPRFAGRPNLLYWHVWDEPHVPGPSSSNRPGFGCYCPHTIERYHRWLEKNCDIEQLNRAWGTSYPALEAIEPPRSVYDIPGMLLWKRFLRENLTETVRWAVELVRSLDLEHAAYASSNHYEPGDSGGFWADCCSDPQIAKIPDIYSTNLHTDGLPPESADYGSTMFNFLTLDWKRSITRGHFWVDELFSTPTLSSMRYRPKASPHLLSLNMWAAVATGASGLLFWQYRPEYRSFEGPAFGVTDLSGNPTERLDCVAKTIRQISRIREHLPFRVPRAQVAIVYHEDSDVLLSMGQLPSTNLLCGLYYTCWRANIPVDVITPDMDWEPYQVIILPDRILMDETLRGKIRRAMMNLEKAPYLLAAGLFGLYDKHGILTMHPPEGLADTLDIRPVEFSAVAPECDDLSVSTVQTNWGSFVLPAGQGYALLRIGQKVLTMASINGETVGAETSDGRFLWLPLPRLRRMPDDAMQVIVSILAEKGVRPPIIVEPEHLLVRRAQSQQGGAILVVFNLCEQPVEAALRDLSGASHAVDLINEKEIGIQNGEMSLTVDGEGVRVLHIQD